MKIKDVAHNHSLTDLLKVSIFSLLMLAPMINVGVRSAYVICNKNAYQSYSGLIKENEYVDLSNLPVYDVYMNISNDLNVAQGSSANYFYIENQEYLTGNITATMENEFNNSNFIRIWNDNGTKYFTFNGSTVNYRFASYSFIFKCDVVNYSISNVNLNKDELFYRIIQFNALDNVFEYSVNQLTESPLYNWVENTAIYSGVELMNTQLGITQPVISLLVVYWLLLTIIYIIIDIIIRVFTWLTHMIGSKTA